MLLIHSQEDGCYGAVIATTEMPLKSAFAKIAASKHRDLDTPRMVDDRTFMVGVGAGTVHVSVAPRGMPSIPKPVLLMDTGAANEDRRNAKLVLRLLAG